jgi:hypothetical protein
MHHNQDAFISMKLVYNNGDLRLSCNQLRVKQMTFTALFFLLGIAVITVGLMTALFETVP